MWLFALGVAVALLAAVFLQNSLGFVMRMEDGRWDGDITHYIYWTRLVTLGGVQNAYGGTWPETYAVYPPVTLYGYQVIGFLYQAFVDPSFELQAALSSRWLHRAVKAVAVFWHLVTGLAIFLLVRRQAGARYAGAAGFLYLANPAALNDAAHWAQPDGAHSVLSVLAVGLMDTGATQLAWGTMALAALAKPQAWAILPLLTLGSWRTARWAGFLRGGITAAAVALVILLPFLLAGRLGEFLGLPSAISSVMPVVTANAHNIWWLLFAQRGLDPLLSNDTARVLGPVTFRMAAATLVLAQLLFVAWLSWTRRAALAEAAALAALGWFLTTTQAHENHLFFVLPLLSLAWPRRPRLLLAFGLLSLTLLLNMTLHDYPLLETLGLDAQDGRLQALRSANAWLNISCFAGWSFAAARRRPAQGPSDARAPMREHLPA